MNHLHHYVLDMDGIGRMRPDEHEAFEERAAIVEFDGGWPRPMAEAEARRMIGMCRWQEQRSGILSAGPLARHAPADTTRGMTLTATPSC